MRRIPAFLALLISSLPLCMLPAQPTNTSLTGRPNGSLEGDHLESEHVRKNQRNEREPSHHAMRVKIEF